MDIRLIVPVTTIAGQELSYRLCRVLPETALMLRDVLREAERLWSRQLGAARFEELLRAPDGEDFFAGRVRIEPAPPDREMVAVWLPFPTDFSARVKPQLVDAIEPFDPAKDPSPPTAYWRATDGRPAS